MLTGKKAFEGKSQASLIGAILEREPTAVSSAATGSTRVARPHRQDMPREGSRTNRFHSAHDLLVQLKWIRDSGSQAAMGPAMRDRPRNRVLLAGVVFLAATATGAAVWMLKPEPVQPIRRLEIVLPDGDVFSGTGRHFVSLSPDGMRLVYVANQRLYLRMTDGLDATPIPGTEEGGAADHARNPFFSPDGQWIGFWQGGQLKKVSVNGGAAVVLCEAVNPWGATWTPDGTILFGQGPQGIFQVSANGGQTSVVVSIDSKTESAHGPQMLPGGKAVLFTLASSAAAPPASQAAFWENAQIVVQSLDSGQRKVLVQGGADARYVSTGHLIYGRQGTLFAIEFDPTRLLTTGNPFPVADRIRQTNAGLGGLATGGQVASSGAVQFTVSQDGLFAYVPQDTQPSVGQRTLIWVDRKGRETPLPVPDRAMCTRAFLQTEHASRSTFEIKSRISGSGIWLVRH